MLEVGKIYQARNGQPVLIVKMESHCWGCAYSFKGVSPLAEDDYLVYYEYGSHFEEGAWDLVRKLSTAETLMNLEVGKWYNARNGGKAHIHSCGNEPQYPYRGIYHYPPGNHCLPQDSTWAANGSYSNLNSECGHDLISECTAPQEIKDTSCTTDDGTRRTFSTGYQRDTGTDKGRWDLLSQAYYGLLRVAQLFQRGAAKYGNANWMKGAPLSVYADCMLRHATKAAAGWDDEDHMSAVAWNALCLMQTQEMIKQGKLPKELDDLPKYKEPK